MTHSLTTTLVSLLAFAAPLAAQSAGDRVRVRTAAFPNEWRTGVVGAQTAESIWLGQEELPRESILRLEVNDGQKSQFVKGLAMGTLIGGGAGLILGELMKSGSDGDAIGEVFSGLAARGALVIGAGAGALIGGLLGANSQTDRWRPISTERLRVAVFSTPRGALALRVGVSF